MIFAFSFLFIFASVCWAQGGDVDIGPLCSDNAAYKDPNYVKEYCERSKSADDVDCACGYCAKDGVTYCIDVLQPRDFTCKQADIDAAQKCQENLTAFRKKAAIGFGIFAAIAIYVTIFVLYCCCCRAQRQRSIEKI